MNPAETLRGLLRRWYITFPGILIAAVLAVSAWFVIPPGYERSATQLLLPGAASLPENSNPLLFLGGLSYATDVLVRAVGAENVLGEISKEYPGTEISIVRDGSSSGPFILITVTAPTDAEAGAVLTALVDETAVVLADLQQGELIAADNRITVVPITVDTESVLQQRDRLVAVGGVGIVGVAISLLLASLVDGLSRQRRASAKPESAAPEGEGEPADEAGVGAERDASVPEVNEDTGPVSIAPVSSSGDRPSIDQPSLPRTGATRGAKTRATRSPTP